MNVGYLVNLYHDLAKSPNPQAKICQKQVKSVTFARLVKQLGDPLWPGLKLSGPFQYFCSGEGNSPPISL